MSYPFNKRYRTFVSWISGEYCEKIMLEVYPKCKNVFYKD